MGEAGLDISGEEFLAVLRFAWPRLIERDECILLESQLWEENYQSWRTSLSGDSTAIEQVINHIHIRDCLPNEKCEDTLLSVGNSLAVMWYSAARRQFPLRDFIVELTNDENDYGPTLYLMTRREPLLDAET